MSARTQTLRRPVAPRAPRRVSGPARTVGSTGRGHARGADDALVLRVLRRTRAVADSRFLDRLVRGRLWIPVVAVMLMGLVFLQVSMLKMNAGIGRAVQSSETLERQNSMLQAEVSRMESEDRIEQVAHQLGMVVPVAGGFHYVDAGHGKADAARALAGMQAPSDAALARVQGGDDALAQATTQAPVQQQAAAAAQQPSAIQTVTPDGQPGAGVGPSQPAAQQAQQQQQAAPVAQAQPQPQPQQQTTAAPAAAAAAGGTAAPTGGQG
ncbi:MAG: hypothetical protein HZB46_13565 [Solirubrobacterales bacterium]|nr:hypothetical protein [Solirubrobacterales bacterium]